MKFFKKRPDEAEIERLRGGIEDSLARMSASARRLSRTAETIGRQRREDELARQIETYRRLGAAE